MSISAKGGSKSWTSAQQNVVNIFNEFSLQDEQLAGRPWQHLNADVLCVAETYERFAYFLTHVYVKGGVKGQGDHLKGDTPKNYFRIAINLAAEKFRPGGAEWIQRFFSCLIEKSATLEARWLRGVTKNIGREVYLRTTKAGEKIDRSESAPPACAPSGRAASSHLVLPLVRSTCVPQRAHQAGERGLLQDRNTGCVGATARRPDDVGQRGPLERMRIHRVRHDGVGP